MTKKLFGRLSPREWKVWLNYSGALIREQLARRLSARESAAAGARGLVPRIECPLCGYQGQSFLPVLSDFGLLRFGAACPDCGALERHRLIKCALEELAFESWEGALLHFSPANCLRQILQSVRGVDYSTADLYPANWLRQTLRRVRGVECSTADLHEAETHYQVDIQNLPFEDDSWDYVVCSHVLEHVASDEKALRGLRRILRPGGVLLLCVPVTPEAEVTVEFGAPADSSLHGHWRAYGADFEQLVSGYFKVQNASADQLSSREALRFGLASSDMLLICS